MSHYLKTEARLYLHRREQLPNMDKALRPVPSTTLAFAWAALNSDTELYHLVSASVTCYCQDEGVGGGILNQAESGVWLEESPAHADGVLHPCSLAQETLFPSTYLFPAIPEIITVVSDNQRHT